MLKKVPSLMFILFFTGCSTLPSLKKDVVTQPTHKIDPPSEKKIVESPSGVKITPYEQKEIKRESIQVKVPEQKIKQQFNDGHSLPAFKNLMQQTKTAFMNNNWDEAERFALQAQRLAPQSAETFMYLAAIANKKEQYTSAESLAQRGLSYAQSNAVKKQLWQTILISGQKQNNNQTVQKAQHALSSL